jgi:hypothetical protein
VGASPHRRPRVLQRALRHFGRRRRQHPDDHGFFDAAALLAGTDVGRLGGKTAESQVGTLSAEFVDVHLLLLALALQLDARRPLLLHHLGLLLVAAAAGARVDPHLEIGVFVAATVVVVVVLVVFVLVLGLFARPFVVVRVRVLAVEIEVGLVRLALGVVAFAVGDDALRRPAIRKGNCLCILPCMCARRAFACMQLLVHRHVMT